MQYVYDIVKSNIKYASSDFLSFGIIFMVYLNNLLHKIAIVRITELDSALRIMCFNTLLNNIGSVAMVSTWSVYVTGILKFSTL